MQTAVLLYCRENKDKGEVYLVTIDTFPFQILAIDGWLKLWAWNPQTLKVNSVHILNARATLRYISKVI